MLWSIKWRLRALLVVASRPVRKAACQSVLLVCSACDSAPPSEHALAPRPSGLAGRWHYGSTGVATYNRLGQLQDEEP